MPHETRPLIGELMESLTQLRYNRVAIHNYCRNADYCCARSQSEAAAQNSVLPRASMKNTA